MKRKVYIVGAGIAGLSCAYYLDKKKFDIEIFEASPYAGGRCRSFHDEQLGMEIDNGNHLIMAANTNLLQLISELGTEGRFHKFKGNVFNFYNGKNGSRYKFQPPFPSLKRYGMKELGEFYKFIFLKKNGTVLDNFKQAPKLFSELINPMSRSILNTASNVADSMMLRNVFWKIMRFGKKGFDHYYPKKSWGNALIEPLLETLQKEGIKINFSSAVKELPKDGIVIIATPPSAAEKFIYITVPEKFEAIYNIHFKFAHKLKPQIYGVINAPVEWFFVKDGIISSTFSAASALELVNDEDIVSYTWDVFCKIFNITAPLPEHRFIKEKRATFICSEMELRKRPKYKTSLPDVYLCGDYVENRMPGTLEGAVLNAKELVKHLN